MISSMYHRNEARPLTLGILGGGQLAKMLAQDAYRLGLRVAIIEHGFDSPAGVMTKLEFGKGWTDADELEAFLDACDIVTLENEFIDHQILSRISDRRILFPSVETLELVQDKYQQKMVMRQAGIPVTAFAATPSLDDLMAFGKNHGFPFVAKTRRLGYDGYGNALIKTEFDARLAWKRFMGAEEPRELMAEAFVPFTRELAVMVARNRRAELEVYPCVETIQEQHICVKVLAPAPIEPSVLRQAQDLAVASVKAIDGVGVFGVEMFLRDDNVVLFNEIAPRPHNSGHYTIEGCSTSQFENCIRAVANLPLGSAAMVSPAAVMLNLLGTRRGPGVPDSVLDALRNSTAHLHLYGKAESRPGRKMGHITALGESLERAEERAQAMKNGLIW